MGRKSVCIIGAGPSGIFAAKKISEVADVVVYEQASTFGGQWVSSFQIIGYIENLNLPTILSPTQK